MPSSLSCSPSSFYASSPSSSSSSFVASLPPLESPCVSPRNNEQTPLLAAHNATALKQSDEEAAITLPKSSGEGLVQQAASTRAVASIISVLLIGVFVSNADGSIVLATHATIASDFRDLSNSSWIFTSYALAAAAAQPLIGKLSDIYGRKAVLLTCYVLFAVGCAWCGLGNSLVQVVLGRVISGAGGAGMTALVSILITDLVPLRDVAAWRSYVNIIATTGRSLGGPLGGWLADSIGWRWSFFGQAPLMAIAIILAWLLVPSSIGTDKATASPQSKTSRLARVDFLGSFLIALTILAFMLPLELGGQKLAWSHPLIPALFGASVVCAALFAVTEARWAKEPVFPLALLRDRDTVTSFAVMALQVAAQLGMMFTVPLYFQVTARVSPTVAGAHLFPAVAGNAVGGLLTGFLIKRSGRYKSMILVATLCSSCSYVIMILRWHGRPSLLESLEIIPGGFGTGIAQSAIFVALTAAVDKEHMAIASSGLYLFSSIGMVVGLATSSAVLECFLHKGLQVAVPRVPDRQAVIDRAIDDIGFVNGLEGELRRVIVGEYVRSLGYTHGISLMFSALGFFVSLFIRSHRL